MEGGEGSDCDEFARSPSAALSGGKIEFSKLKFQILARRDALKWGWGCCRTQLASAKPASRHEFQRGLVAVSLLSQIHCMCAFRIYKRRCRGGGKGQQVHFCERKKQHCSHQQEHQCWEWDGITCSFQTTSCEIKSIGRKKKRFPPLPPPDEQQPCA